MHNATSSLTPHFHATGSTFSTTHPDWMQHGITEVKYLGTHGTKSGLYYLLEGKRPDGTTKSYNFSKALIHSGRIDHHFSHVSSSVAPKHHVSLDEIKTEIGTLQTLLDNVQDSSSV